MTEPRDNTTGCAVAFLIVMTALATVGAVTILRAVL